MAYTTTQAVKNKLASLYQDGLRDEEHIDPAIAYADATIDAMLSDYYTVPFTTTPALVEQLSTNLAAAEVLRLIFQDRQLDLPNAVTNLRDDALDLLERIQHNRASLPGETRIL